MYARAWSVAPGRTFAVDRQTLRPGVSNNCEASSPLCPGQPIRAHLSRYAETFEKKYPELATRCLQVPSPSVVTVLVQVPKRGDWEVAYDIWLDDWVIKVMILAV